MPRADFGSVKDKGYKPDHVYDRRQSQLMNHSQDMNDQCRVNIEDTAKAKPQEADDANKTNAKPRSCAKSESHILESLS